MHEILLGFDLRWGLKQTHDRWTEESRELFLLAPSVYSPASVDRNIWPSLFDYYPGPPFERAKDKVVVDREEWFNFRQNMLSLWGNASEMVNFYKYYAGDIDENIEAIAVSLLLDDAETLDEYWPPILDPVAKRETPVLIGEWPSLGYDVADAGDISGLSDCGYTTSELDMFRPLWSPRLNTRGLFDNLCDAAEFKLLSDLRVPEHSPFYVYHVRSCSITDIPEPAETFSEAVRAWISHVFRRDGV